MGAKDIFRRVANVDAWLRHAATGLVVFLLFIFGFAACSTDYEDTPDSPEATTQTDPNTFPEDMSDPDYSGSNGSDAESYCSEINSPDMEACQDGYNNLADSLSGG